MEIKEEWWFWYRSVIPFLLFQLENNAAVKARRLDERKDYLSKLLCQASIHKSTMDFVYNVIQGFRSSLPTELCKYHCQFVPGQGLLP
jgi:hypothetical protein